MPFAALLPLVMQLIGYIPTITVGINELVSWIGSFRAAAKQANAWTDEAETAFLEALLKRREDRAYKTDAELEALPVTPSPVALVNVTGTPEQPTQ